MRDLKMDYDAERDESTITAILPFSVKDKLKFLFCKSVKLTAKFKFYGSTKCHGVYIEPFTEKKEPKNVLQGCIYGYVDNLGECAISKKTGAGAHKCIKELCKAWRIGEAK